MPNLQLALRGFAGAILAISGCAPDSGPCAEGTTQMNGVCTGSPTCTDGTRLNRATNACEVDPSACQGGTVLINGQCVDPAQGLVVDLEEGPEPNGLAGYDFIEDVMLETKDAGAIALKPPDGAAFVIHGCIAPVNGKSDYDAYTLTVNGPTLIEVTVDGVGGLTPGFFIDLDLWSLKGDFFHNYRRSAVTLTNDTSQRELFLPTAGTYTLLIADTRSLLWGAPFGASDGSSCYYASITQRTPTPTPLDLTAGANGSLDDKVKFYTVAGGDRFTHLTIRADSTLSREEEARTRKSPDAVLVGNHGELRQLANSDRERGELRFAGTESALLAVDINRHYESETRNFSIAVEQYEIGVRLPEDGSSVIARVNSNSVNVAMPRAWCEAQNYLCPLSGDCCYAPNYRGYNYFYYDVNSDREFTGMKLQFSTPVQGGVITRDGEHVAEFGGQFGTRTFTEFAGIVRGRAPGRYYLWVMAPGSAVNDPFTVTSTYRSLTPTPLTANAATSPMDLDPVFRSNIFTYDPNSPGWQQLTATGTNMGEVVVRRYHPTVFGRLDPLTITDEFGQTSTDQGLPWYPEHGLYDPGTVSLPEDGSGPRSEVSFGTQSPLYLKVTASTPTANSRFNLSVTTRPSAYDVGSLATGSTTTLTDQAITATPPTDLQRYFFSTAPGNLVTITVTPTLGFDAIVATLNQNETDQASYNATTSGAEVAKFRQDSSGGTAFVVRSASAAQGAFHIAIRVESPYYRVTNSSTAFQDTCVGGTRVALVPDGTLDNYGSVRAASDDGLSAAPIATPSGFRFYGASVPGLVVSTNGFFSFDTGIRYSIPSPVTCGIENSQMVCTRVVVPGNYEPPPTLAAASDAGTLPDGVGTVHIAPYWNNLKNVVVCQKLTGTRLTVQWTGDTVSIWDEFGTGGAGGSVGPGLQPLRLDVNRPVQMQVILDASDQSIEFVYGPKMFVRSDTGGAGGVQDLGGLDGTESFDCNQPPFPSGTLPKAMTSVKFVHP